MMEPVEYIIAYVDIVKFENVHEHRLFEVHLNRTTENNNKILSPNEFIRVKTTFNESFYFDFKIGKIVLDKDKWIIFLGTRIDFYVEGKRWSRPNYKNEKENSGSSLGAK